MQAYLALLNRSVDLVTVDDAASEQENYEGGARRKGRRTRGTERLEGEDFRSTSDGESGEEEIGK
jgi:hypothetical protein